MKKIITLVTSWVVLIIAVLTFAGCATNAATGNKDLMLVDEDEEIQLSRKEHEHLVRGEGIYSDKQLQDYVRRVGERIVKVSDRKNIQYQFFVLNQPEVNAFALPNGNIYVTRGLLAYLGSEAELAAVLSHEISHVAARHGAQLLSDARVAAAASAVVGVIAGIAVGAATGDVSLAQSTMDLTSNMSAAAGVLILGNYSREHELEADKLGTGYLTRAGYPPEAMAKVLETLKSIEKFEAARLAKGGKKQHVYHPALATHPALEERLEKVGVAPVLMQAEGIVQDEYLERTSGIVFEAFDASRPVQARNDIWLVRESLFQVYVPADWKVVESSKDRVLLEKAQDLARTEFRLLQPESDQKPESFFSGPHVGASDIKDVMELKHIYHKRPAFSAIANVKAGDAVQPAYLGVLFHERFTVLVTGAHKDPAWLGKHRYVFDAQTNMTKLLTQEEYNQTRIKRVKLVKAGQGDTYSALATAGPLGAAGEGYLRLLNHQYPTGEPAAGQSVKIVIADE